MEESDDITRVSSEDLSSIEGDTDWDRVESLTDEDIDAAVEADPDQELLDEEWFEHAMVVRGQTKLAKVPTLSVNAFLQATRVVSYEMDINPYGTGERKARRYMETRPRIECADGLNLSVQAGYGIYSVPRNDATRYTCVEVGFPSRPLDDLMDWFEGGSGGVYSYVPVDRLDEVVEEAGGIVAICLDAKRNSDEMKEKAYAFAAKHGIEVVETLEAL